MMKKLVIVGIVSLFLFSPVALAGYGLLSTLSFGGSAEIDTLSGTSFGLLSTLSFGGSAEIDTLSGTSFGLLSTLSFGGSAEILENSCPVSSGFSIVNGTTDVSIIPHP